MMDRLAEHAPSIALVFFFIFFVATALWVYWPRNKTRIEAWRNIPLKEQAG